MGCEDNSIARWTAPTCELQFEVSVDFIQKVRITYAQGEGEDGKPIIKVVKTEDDCEFFDNIIRFGLTQEETLSFDPDEYVLIEVQVYDVNGVPYVGETAMARVQNVINEGVSW